MSCSSEATAVLDRLSSRIFLGAIRWPNTQGLPTSTYTASLIFTFTINYMDSKDKGNMFKVPHPPSHSSPLSHFPSTNKNPNPYTVDGEPPKNLSRLSSSSISHVNSSENKIGQVKAVKKIREGLLVEVANFTQAKKICQMQTFGGQPITVVPHERLNCTKGIISHRDLLNCSVDEIAEALSEDGVVEAKRMMTKRNGVSVNTASMSVIRSHICKLQKNPICNCGKPVHENSGCEEPFVCVNCDGNHSSLSPQCPIYRLEKEIKTIQTLQKIPYAEARKQVVPKRGLLYSQIAAKPNQTSNIVPAVQALVPQITAAMSDSAKDKRKRNESGSTDPGSVREDDLSVIDSSAKSNEELSTGKKKKKGWPLGKPHKGCQGDNR
ncbi:hypothetical protein ILUMI_00559 [Ignelater luminosus]|uniref:Gag-like protein n=1 Tax=Ignelater luminosus TaxID=2038154 RepID=A0A8K0DJZ8_IGNLU|nr:hypothetical protein ILUMI_00559 [Ignelater luminosus]